MVVTCQRQVWDTTCCTGNRRITAASFSPLQIQAKWRSRGGELASKPGFGVSLRVFQPPCLNILLPLDSVPSRRCGDLASPKGMNRIL